MHITTTATFCSTLVDEWERYGITQAFIAPGSRSTPLALAFAASEAITTHVFHDERSASFAALGAALADPDGLPTILVCTSGTAAAHFHAAVIEADLSAVPLLVCTADRPPELWEVGAPQTINQTHLYNHSVRWFFEPGVPTDETRHQWRSLAARAAAEASGRNQPPGPVHLNLSFRDPLAGIPGDLPAGRPDGNPWHQWATAQSAPEPTTNLHDLVFHPDGSVKDGVIVAGRRCGSLTTIQTLATRLGWPVLADHRSGYRGLPHSVSHFDALLRCNPLATAHPDVIFRMGEPPSSKALSQWVARHANDGATVVTVIDDDRWVDPERVTHQFLPSRQVDGLADELAPDRSHLDTPNPSGLPASDSSGLRAPSTWAHGWQQADTIAHQHIVDAMEHAHHTSPIPEILATRAVVASLPPASALVVSSSMPIRNLEWYADGRPDVAVYANRGANGIDGVLATAIGVAATTGQPTTVVVGDIATNHDASSLVAVAQRSLNLHIVVMDNDGGGIFSFLPQKQLLDDATFVRFFDTPHHTDFGALFRAHRVPCSDRLTSAAALHHHLAAPPPGRPVRATWIATDRAANTEQQADLLASVEKALVALPSGLFA